MAMSEQQAKRVFDKYNPAKDVVRCPNGRAKTRQLLDIYATTAVDLYGIIKRTELADIYNSQQEDQTTGDEIYTLLLPLVLKSHRYMFYKDYIIHREIMPSFELVEYLAFKQSGKRRFIPPADEMRSYQRNSYYENSVWMNVLTGMWQIFGQQPKVADAFYAMKEAMVLNTDLAVIPQVLQRFDLVTETTEQLQDLLDLVTEALNNSRIWENKGYTPNEMAEAMKQRVEAEPTIWKAPKIRSNQKCPCGSGKSYRDCCGITDAAGSACVSKKAMTMFYATWYSLLEFANQQLNIVPELAREQWEVPPDGALLFKIREALWANLWLFDRYLERDEEMPERLIDLIKSWKQRHIRERFIVMQYHAQYAVFMRNNEGKDLTLYAVKGLVNSVAHTLHRPTPVVVEATLLPLDDEIVYDTYLAPLPFELGTSMKEALERAFAETKLKSGIVKHLLSSVGSDSA